MSETHETPDTNRQQMEETKSDIADKLESLELKVVESVQSTSTAVSETAEAVQETVETVTDALQDVVHSLSNAFDLRRQLDRHPWLNLGGCAALGYLAFGYLSTPKKDERTQKDEPLNSPPLANQVRFENGALFKDAISPSAASDSSPETDGESSAWHQLKLAAVQALVGIVREVAARSVPAVADFLTEPSIESKVNDPELTEEPQCSVSPSAGLSPWEQSRPVVSFTNVRSGNSF
jgi:hypothetical protein